MQDDWRRWTSAMGVLLLLAPAALADRGPIPEFTPEDIFLFEGSGLINGTCDKTSLYAVALNDAIATHGDRFDYVITFTAFPPGPSCGGGTTIPDYDGYLNYTLGLGTPPNPGTSQWNRNIEFGVNSQRLRGVISMWDLWTLGSRSPIASTLTQEFIHSAGVYLGTFSGGRSFAGDGLSCGRAIHWNFRLDGGGSAMEMREWKGGPATRLTSSGDDPVLVGSKTGISSDIPGSHFSYPDLYLFGVVTAGEMDSLASELRYMNDDGTGTCNTPHTGPISSWGSADIIGSLDPQFSTPVGPRRPSADKARKDLSTLIVVFHDTGAPPTDEQKEHIAVLVNTMMDNMHLSTLGRGTMRTTLPRDCDGNGIEDETDIDDLGAADCNADRVPDRCEPSTDADDNGVQDICEVGPGQADCNDNDVPDAYDIAGGTSADAGFDGIPDECQSNVLYVDADASSGAGHGTNWTDAYVSLQDALRVAASGDATVEEIWVAEGTYVPTVDGRRFRAFYLVDGVGVYGGFAGTETLRGQRNPVAHPTILSGDLAGDDDADFVNAEENSLHVVIGNAVGPTAILDGFTVSGGYADLGADSYGAGMVLFDAGPELRNLVFESNRALQVAGTPLSGSGAALSLVNDCRPTIVDCTFEGNVSDGDGGAVLVFDSTPTIVGSQFIANRAADGGAIRVEGWSSGTAIEGCSIRENEASGSGGGLSVNGTAVRLADSDVTLNSAGGDGGGVYVFGAAGGTTISNTLVVANVADSGGGLGINSSDVEIRNVTAAGNIASTAGGGIRFAPTVDPDVANAVFFSNTPDDLDGGQTTTTVAHSRVDDLSTWNGVGNIDADPSFVADPDPGPDGTWDGVDDDLGNQRLTLASPAIDAGNSNQAPTGATLDVFGNPRRANVVSVPNTGVGGPAVIDMGAHEFPGTGADLDGDGFENAFDNCPSNPNPGQQDTDRDGSGDACDTCTDSDGDGFGDPGFAANTCPQDSCPGFDDAVNADGDFLPDGCDNCPSSSNNSQIDSVGDGVGDACDNCVTVDNPGQENCNGDAEGDACDLDSGEDDSDRDGLCSDVDNCPAVWNPTQEDCNGDGQGDVCESSPGQTDPDGDGICTALDPCPLVPEDFLNGLDSDGDMIRDICDPCPTGASVDGDLDGVCDERDICPGFDDTVDTDSDGRPDGCDADDDGDFTVDADDCASTDPTAFDTPGVMSDLLFSDRDTIVWDDIAPGFGSSTVYDLMRGQTSELPVGSGAGESCIAQGTASTLDVSGDPAPGQAYYFLGRLRNNCADGTWDADLQNPARDYGGCD